ncbi:CHAT domain-containing protein [Micromonospora sp. NPDC049230]|uniref:CHAT domain-containing protein n=1 Tax=Micromonospora sp. NPDC049230 TaxID=3155502 RepID=UPI0034104D6F
MAIANLERSGTLPHLDRSITHLRTAVTVTPATHTEHLPQVTRLIGALLARHDRTGMPADLDEAETLARRAAAEPTKDPAVRSDVLSALSRVLRHRATTLDDYRQAAEYARQAIAAAPDDGSRWRIQGYESLSSILMLRYLHTADPVDLDMAIAAQRVVLADDRRSAAHGAESLNALSVKLRTRYQRTGNGADLDEALTLARAAVDVEGDRPTAAAYLWTLGITLQVRFDRDGDPRDAAEATELWSRVTGDELAAPIRRVFAARDWARLAVRREDWPEALRGYIATVRLLPVLAWHGRGREVNEQSLRAVPGVAWESAAAALNCGQADTAVTLLEQGRAVMWNHLLNTHTDLDTVRAFDPELADELTTVRETLDSYDRTATAPAGAAGLDPADQVALAERWRGLLAAARRLPGLGHFLDTADLATLRPEEGSGPVVLVNLSPWRCDAIIVDHRQTRVIPLTTTMDQAVDVTVTYEKALLRHAAQRRLSSRAAMEVTITDTLQWLWDVITEPVLRALGLTGPPADDQPWPRVWWCPTGFLQTLPLHAAGYHDQPGRNVPDRVVSSYTPGLRAHSYARRNRSAPPSDQMLIVCAADTAEADALPAVAFERDELLALLPKPARHLREGPAATRGAVLESLSTCTMVHFSCHGRQNLERPLRSGLVLADGVLTVDDLTAVTGPRAMAVLSACRTATVAATTLDETISLAAGLHFGGWRHVVATLWSVSDRDAADITVDFYRRLANNGRLDPEKAAAALHAATRAARHGAPDHPSRWVHFIHLGA